MKQTINDSNLQVCTRDRKDAKVGRMIGTVKLAAVFGMALHCHLRIAKKKKKGMDLIAKYWL